MARKAARDGGADILNDRAFFAGDHANHARQKGQGALAAFVEQPFFQQAFAQRFDARKQGAFAGIFQSFNHQLVF